MSTVYAAYAARDARGDTFDPHAIDWVVTRADVARLLARIESCPVIVYDLETTGLDENAVTGGRANGGVAARVVLVSFTFPDPDGGEPDTFVVPLSHPQSPWMGQWRKLHGLLAERMADQRERNVLLVGHNVKYDHRYTYATTGVDLTRCRVWDTVVAARLMDEDASAKLKNLVPTLFDIQRWDDVDLTYPGAAEFEPLFKLGVYAARDTYWTYRLFVHQSEALFLDEGCEPLSPDEVTDARLGQLAQIVSMPCTATLTAIEQRGVLLDQDWTRERLAEHESAAATLAGELAGRYTVKEDRALSFAPTSLWFRAWAAAAVEAGDLHVAALTPGGVPQWSALVLKRQARSGSEVAASLLALRGHEKKAEFLRSWLDKATPDGRICATYNIGTARSGRLSSSGPNLQQVTGELKPAFVPRPGHVIAEVDYSQIEMRVSAVISRCEPMLAAFQRGDDLHLKLAGGLNGKEAIQGAKLCLLRRGLPADRTGAETLLWMRSSAGARALSDQVVQLRCAGWSDQESGSWERWSAVRLGQSSVEWGEGSPVLPKIPKELVRALRSTYDRIGWPWEWETDDLGRPSQGSKPLEQSSLELGDALQVVSSVGAQELAKLTGVDWKSLRQRGKAGGFGLIFGMGPAGFIDYAEASYGVVMTMDEAVQMHRAFFEMWPGLTEWHLRAEAEMRRTGRVVSPLGRVRRFTTLGYGSDRELGDAIRQAINSPVQGTASDLMQLAASSIEGTLAGVDSVAGARLVGTVHDSILVEVPAERWEAVVRACMDRMASIGDYVHEVFGVVIDVPLASEAKVGTRWGLSDVGVLE